MGGGGTDEPVRFAPLRHTTPGTATAYSQRTHTQHKAATHTVLVIVWQTKLTVRGCYVPPRGEMALAPTSRQRPLHLFPFYSQESHEFSHMLKVLLIDGAEIGSL